MVKLEGKEQELKNNITSFDSNGNLVTSQSDINESVETPIETPSENTV